MTSRMRLDRRDLIAVAFLLFATLLFYWPLITPDPANRYAYPAGDFYNQFHAFASYEHDRLWAGEIPLWNPYTFGGHPFLADVQAAVFYPPSLLIVLLSGPGPFSPQWLVVEAAAHTFLGAVFTYLLVRRLVALFTRFLSVTGALISALTFAFGGYLTGYPPLQLAILETQVWLPMILLLVDIGLSRRRWWPILGAGMAWGMAVLAGHPQSAMYVFYCALLYGLFRSWHIRVPWRWAVGAHVGWIGVGLGLAAVHLLPAWEFMRLSVRARPFVPLRVSIPWDTTGLPYEALAGGFELRDLAQYVLPGAFTPWSPVYVGIFSLCLAGLACLGACSRTWPRERVVPQIAFWAVLAGGSLILSLGGNTFVYRLFYWAVPGFRLFRSQERAIYVTSFSLAVLAGYGWTWLSTAGANAFWQRRACLGVLGWAVLATAIAALVLIVGPRNPDWQTARWRAQLLRWVGFSWAGWVLVRSVMRWRPFVPLRARPLGQSRGTRGTMGWWWFATSAMSIALVMVDLFVVNIGTNLSPGEADERVYDRTHDGAWLAPIFDDERRFRIVNDFGLPGNSGLWLHLEDLSGASPLRLQAHKVVSDALPRWRLWQLFDVRYVATWEHDLPGPFAATRVAMQGVEWEKNTVYVHRLQVDFPRAWVVHRVRQVGDLEALALLADPDFDPFDEVLLADQVQFVPGTPDRLSTAQIVVYAPEEVVVRTDLSAPGWLVLGEWYYPGWQVWVDDVRQTVYRANYGLRAVPVAAGSHQIISRYRPASFYAGSVISVLTLVGLLFVSGRCWVVSKMGRSDEELFKQMLALRSSGVSISVLWFEGSIH